MTMFVSTAVYAGGAFYNKTVIDEKDKVTYLFGMNYDLTPYDIKVEPKYIPEGYQVTDQGNDSIKIENTVSDREILVLSCNGASIDEQTSLNFTNVKAVEKTKIQNLETHIYTMEDRKLEIKDIVMFNEEDGYLIYIYSDGAELPIEELKKVAENLKITKLDTKTAYRSAMERKAQEVADELWIRRVYDFLVDGIPKKRVCEIGEEMKNPVLEKLFPADVADIRYTVQSVEIKDTLPKDEFPEENFVQYKEVKPWLEADGTLKSRMRYQNDGGVSRVDKMVASKFVVVKMKARNLKESKNGMEKDPMFGVDIAPDLGFYKARSDGNLVEYLKEAYLQERDYSLQGGGYGDFSIPIYFDEAICREGYERLKHFLWHPLAEGEELEYTLVYVIDEDLIEHAYLRNYFSGNVLDGKDSTYVKITK